MANTCDAIIGTGKARPARDDEGLKAATLQPQRFGVDKSVHTLLELYAWTPCTTMLRAARIHPALNEAIPTMLGDPEPLGPA